MFVVLCAHVSLAVLYFMKHLQGKQDLETPMMIWLFDSSVMSVILLCYPGGLIVVLVIFVVMTGLRQRKGVI